MRKLVDARKRHGTNVPHLLWKYLTFEHNEHEVDLAIRTAEELGVDQICIATPIVPGGLGRSLRACRRLSEGGSLHLPRHADDTTRSTAGRVAPDIELANDALFRRPGSGAATSSGFLCKAPSRAPRLVDGFMRASRSTRAVTSCPVRMPPESTEHRVYGVFPGSEPDPFLARDMIAWPSRTDSPLFVTPRSIRRVRSPSARSAPPIQT